jgi:hypothetical protein
MNLVLKGTELMGPVANSYWLLTEMDPSHFRGFMGFVSNPGALKGGFTSGVTTTTTTTVQKALDDLDSAFARAGKTLDVDVMAGLNDAYKLLRSLMP